MPSHWRAVIKRISRDADWASAAPASVETALMKELRELLGSETARRATAVFDQRQGSLLRPEHALARSPGELHGRFYDHMCVAYEDGLRGEELVRASIASALGELLEARKREIVAHTAARDGRSVSEMKRRLEAVANGLVERAVDRRRARLSLDPAARLSFDLDATDLLRGFE